MVLSALVRPAVLGHSTEDFIRAVPLFAGLSATETAALARQATTVTLPAGAWLFHQGDIADAMYVVRSGRLQVVEERSDGSREVKRELRAGAPLGELALIRRSPRTAGVRVRRDAVLLRLDAARFEEILRSSTSVSHALLDTLAYWLSNGTGSQPVRTPSHRRRSPSSASTRRQQHKESTESSSDSSGSWQGSSALRRLPRRDREPKPVTRWRSSSIVPSTALTTCF